MATRVKASAEGVRQSYPPRKARRDQVQNPFSYYVWEPVAFRLAPFFIKGWLSPFRDEGLRETGAVAPPSRKMPTTQPLLLMGE